MTDADPVPTPARVLLPAPDGRRGSTARWRLSVGGRVYASPGGIYRDGDTDLDAIEADALAVLAACAWARASKTSDRGEVT